MTFEFAVFFIYNIYVEKNILTAWSAVEKKTQQGVLRMSKTSKTYVVFKKLVLVKEKGAMYDCPKQIKCPLDAYEAIREITKLDQEAQEVFGIITLDTKNKIISVHEISRGTLSESLVHPREVFKVALLHNAASIMLFHNHPSGDPNPSEADVEITDRLVKSGELLGITVMDHIIVGDEDYISLREMGLI